MGERVRDASSSRSNAGGGGGGKGGEDGGAWLDRVLGSRSGCFDLADGSRDAVSGVMMSCGFAGRFCQK